MRRHENAVLFILNVLVENFWRRILTSVSINHFYPEKQFVKCNKQLN